MSSNIMSHVVKQRHMLRENKLSHLSWEIIKGGCLKHLPNIISLYIYNHFRQNLFYRQEILFNNSSKLC
jgi:hypothetical protein